MAHQSLFNKRPILIVSGVLIPSLLVVVLAVLVYRSKQELNTTEHWVAHTMDVQHHIQALGLELANVEAGQRGYLLTTNEAYLQAYQGGLQNVPIESDILRALTTDNPIQQTNLKSIGLLIADKLSELAQTISLQRQGRRDAALALVETDRGQKDSVAIRQMLSKMDDEERRLLTQRQHRLTHESAVNTALAMSMVGLAAVFAGFVFFLFHRLARSEAWVTVCAWSKTIEHEGQWLTFEQYLQKRFNFHISHGMSPKGTGQFFESKASAGSEKKASATGDRAHS